MIRTLGILYIIKTVLPIMVKVSTNTFALITTVVVNVYFKSTFNLV